MAQQFKSLEDQHISFINDQHLFFVGSAAQEGYVNISPKGGDALRVLGPSRIIWRNLTGSGNETAGHLKKINRMTLMWCSFTTRPLILRSYGPARCITPQSPDWAALNAHFSEHIGARQIYDLTIELVQTSCGYAVPFMSFKSDRTTLDTWSRDRGADGIQAYWTERNSQTIDGYPTT